MGESGERLICAAAVLADGGDGVRFTVVRRGEKIPAFAVRYRGVVHAYLNRCAHRGLTLDWDAGKFFDRARRLLICAVHGASYEPATGACVGGPCNGGLVKVPVIEKNSGVYLMSYEKVESGK